jgi:cyclopropane-fatty-acyl-phospholipid synthase
MKKSNICPICSKAMEEVIDLPGLPMTELYEPYTDTFEQGRGRIDNALLYCEPCCHAKLETVVPPEMLYVDYRTKTSKSVGASHSIMSFFSFINKKLDLTQFETVIDIGGNDGSFLSLFRTQKKVNVDPNGSNADVVLMGYVEEQDLIDFKASKKLITCSHTLEHLEDPRKLLKKIDEVLCYGDVCAFQFPSLDCLIRDARIDQVHHQHIHYYSLASISTVLGQYGFEIVSHDFDESHYGTLRVLFRRGKGEWTGSPIKIHEIEIANSDFITEMVCFNDAIGRLREPVGYGASLMLPLLRYYVPNLDRLGFIADDDASKKGLRWINFNKRIVQPLCQLSGADIVVTAFNTKLAVRKIVNKLTNEGARNILVPFHSL